MKKALHPIIAAILLITALSLSLIPSLALAMPRADSNQLSPPTVTLSGPDAIVLQQGQALYTEQGAQAFCEKDGDISDGIFISGSVNTNEAGTYIMTYTAINSLGLSHSVTRRVTVVSPEDSLAYISDLPEVPLAAPPGVDPLLLAFLVVMALSAGATVVMSLGIPLGRTSKSKTLR